ncbi:HAD family hydrolase [Staphylospora marina]|uniref:HAD family hydrolase n=1 Tax=Staphylospora marina TaxID=2490858 RepID=UPI0013DDC9A1|nr:HAD family hydrolase [Staphylospora marina]
MIKLFVSDLDNTLFTEGKTVREEDRRAIRRLAESGVRICLASGRMDKELLCVAEELGVSCHRISQNGAFVYTQSGESLLSVHFEGNLARRLFEESLKTGVAVFLSTEDRMLVPRMTEQIRAIEHRMLFPVEENPRVFDEIGRSLKPSKICLIGPIERLLSLRSLVNDMVPGQVDTFISDRDCLDLMPPGISKGNALRILREHLGIRPEETVTIGDSYNDISMLESVPHSFAMAHADEEVKRRAARTAESVAEAVEWVLEHMNQPTK